MFSPDYLLNHLKFYHKSNYLLLPTASLHIINYKFNLNYDNYLYPPSFILLGYHSYFSSSQIITDYIKPKNLNLFFRASNLNIHFISCFGFLNYLYQKKNKA